MVCAIHALDTGGLSFEKRRMRALAWLVVGLLVVGGAGCFGGVPECPSGAAWVVRETVVNDEELLVGLVEDSAVTVEYRTFAARLWTDGQPRALTPPGPPFFGEPNFSSVVLGEGPEFVVVSGATLLRSSLSSDVSATLENLSSPWVRTSPWSDPPSWRAGEPRGAISSSAYLTDTAVVVFSSRLRPEQVIEVEDANLDRIVAAASSPAGDLICATVERSDAAPRFRLHCFETDKAPAKLLAAEGTPLASALTVLPLALDDLRVAVLPGPQLIPFDPMGAQESPLQVGSTRCGVFVRDVLDTGSTWYASLGGELRPMPPGRWRFSATAAWTRPAQGRIAIATSGTAGP